MEFRLLGLVEVRAGGTVVDAGRPRQRMVLSALLVDAGRVVPTHVLIDRVWGDALPGNVLGTLRAHIARIRRVLERASALGDEPLQLIHRAGGYVLDLDPDRIDLHRARRLLRASREDGCRDERRLGLLREAIRLWQGEPLTGLDGDWVNRMRLAWERERVELVLAWARAELRGDNPEAVLGPLHELAERHPLVESLAAMLMRALAAAGRPAEALERYANLRAKLVAELGAEPGPELQAVHRAVLRGELDGQDAKATATPVVPVVPAQLPADVSAFTGRDSELNRIDELLSQVGAGGDTAVLISAVSGTAGVGKTALAIHWAHRVRERFPDGQLYVNLRGYDPDQPVSPADALAGFLAALGVSGQDVPIGLDERAARYRSEIADRRVLIVLDNAATVEQVRPLLPGTPSCMVLVTSRDSLAGLVAVHGAVRLDLDLLPLGDAVALLRRLVGTRVDAEPTAAAALAGQCARLPLALRIAAELVVTRATTPLADLVAEFSDLHRRLDLLDGGGDPRIAVSAVFSWSVRHLEPPAARMFRLLGLHPGPDADAHAAAALADTGLDSARQALDRLARACLVTQTGHGRFGMHDLLRAYAVELAGADLAADDLKAALRRLFDYYLATAAAAVDLLYPAEVHRRPRVGPARTPVPAITDPQSARGWLEAERACLAACAAHTADHDLPEHAVRLSSILFRYLYGGYATEALAVHGYARQAAQLTGDVAGEAQAALGLGVAHVQLGRYVMGGWHFEQAVALFGRSGDRTGEQHALTNLGTVLWWQGQYAAAGERYSRSLALCRQMGDRIGEARALGNLASVEERLGHYDSAAEHVRRALALFREAGDRTGEPEALSNLGLVEARLHQFEPALRHLRQALEMFAQLGSPRGEGYTLDNLGIACTLQGQPDEALGHHLRARALLRGIGDRDGEASALNGMGEAAQAGGDPADAVTHHTAALAVGSTARDQQARAHDGLGRAYLALGELAQARQHGQRAAELYTELNVPFADWQKGG
ncbi:MAG TPA: tetratricopeptide repeat protein [Candidatus Limnocylindrales bacterium]